MDTFRVRLNCIDHYQGTPTRYDPRLRNDVRPSQISKGPKVPVVRVFGSTETGQKVCAHIHGVFPYLYIEYTGSLAPEDVGAYILRLHLSIDHALAVSYRRNDYRETPMFVARITLVKGVPFYGYHVGYHFYLKIYMYNPVYMTRLADLLQQGVIMSRKFQPYEAHLQYLLQFLIDYNLYGCDYLDSSRVVFRSPVPRYEDADNASHLWHSESIPEERITDDFSLPRVSHCSIEVDICVRDILNRKAVKERRLHHDFREMNQRLPPNMKLVPSMAGLWKDETKRRRRRMGILDPRSSPFPPEALVSMSADSRDSQPTGWIHEEEYREQVEELIHEEQEGGDGSPVSFDDFAEQKPLEHTVKTTLEAVEDLYPENLLPSLGLSQPLADGDQIPPSSIDIDEKGILKFGDNVEGDEDLFPDDSDEELIRETELAEQAAARAAQAEQADPEPPLRRTKMTVNNLVDKSELFAKASLDPSATSSSVSDTPTFNSLPRGICASGQKHGILPKMPVSKEFVKAAEDDGLISKYPRVQDDAHRLQSLKRLRSATGENLDVKRLKIEIEPAGVETGDPKRHDIKEPVPSQTATKEERHVRFQPSSQPRKTVATGNSIKRQPNQTIGFPVVKDPNDPTTRLRLSQQSNSQLSEDDVPKKSISFEPMAKPPTEPSSSELGEGHSGTPSSPPSFLSPTTLGKATPHSSHDTYPGYGSLVCVLNNPPPASEVCATMQDYGLPDVIYQDAFYSKEKDVPPRAREYAGREFRLESTTLPFLPEFDPAGQSPATFGRKQEAPLDRRKAELQYERRQRQCTLRSWEMAEPPPTFDEVNDWWLKLGEDSKPRHPNSAAQTVPLSTPARRKFLSQIDGPTPRNKHGFKYSQAQSSTSVQHETQYMSTMSLEVHVNTRGTLVPNPEEDEVQCIFWCVSSDEQLHNGSQSSDRALSGVVVLSEDGSSAQKIRSQISTALVMEESSELDVMVRMVEIVRTYDPDILTGYEVHGSSWGYLIERARFKYDYNLCDEFSRMKSQSHGRFGKEADRWGFNTTSTIRVTGRHMINIWRAMRGELNLLQYTMENVVWHLLHRRIPHYSWRTLSDWYTKGRPRDLSKVLRYYLTRTRLDVQILEDNELIARTSEQARLLGVDFFSVFSRGSQYKVESIMFRIAKPENFVLVSPSRKQVGGQNALECLPLVMEPQSAFYNSPLLVLDFQSLYPSVMIAYNYCYSTFLGRIVNWCGTNKMGFTEYKRHQRLLELLRDHINIAPNGMMYTKVEVRKSLLAKMLTEILETRVMVKSGMKQDKDDKTLQKLLNNRQLALKLLANVTYGYTSASFSGRMPCSEIADSIVQTARETLERAIAYIHSVGRWGAEVVYGDTDSLFVYLKGRTREQAFDIGQEIAKEITDMNPRPIKLKFEKVYHPCVLLAKKRYVGYKYESRDQKQPEFDAKGIETVRRDGTPAEQKIEEKALKLLFETADLSQIKAYFQKQCEKIMRGQVSIQDFCFAREVKLGTYSDKGPPPPGALISTRRMLEDARAEPQYGERVPYVVVTGAPGARLIDRCVAPEELLGNSHCQLDAEYYISKNLIPPLERIFNLVGANVRQWYDEMPKVQRIRRIDHSAGGGLMGAARRKKITLESYLKSASCVVCGAKMKTSGAGEAPSLCSRCRRDRPGSLLKLQTRLRAEEQKLADVVKVCQSCAALAPLDDVPCDSKDCPVFYTRQKQAARLGSERSIVGPVVRQLAEMGVGRKAMEW
ncbi:DNA polymerase [Pleurostoma richardsiae]|uniref:DNA polymerase n=1 Tax=Pleurostoma richardsiae TaxID=41990 RepID=A0AA38SBL1_9PEZI|nr:DNA polymerase [Pleurostoma richardsiae]